VGKAIDLVACSPDERSDIRDGVAPDVAALIRATGRRLAPSLRAQRSNPPLRKPRYGLLRCARNDREKSYTQMLLPRRDPLPDRFGYRHRAMGLLVGIHPDDFTGHERLVAAFPEDRKFESEA